MPTKENYIERTGDYVEIRLDNSTYLFHADTYEKLVAMVIFQKEIDNEAK